MAFALTAFIALIGISTPKGLDLTATSPPAFDGNDALHLAEDVTAAAQGSGGDVAVTALITRALTEVGSPPVVERFSGTAPDGSSTTETNLVATLPGASHGTILIVASRDAGPLGTATLIELARVFAVEQHTRTIVLASLGGGADGDAGARFLASHLPRSLGKPVMLLGIRSIGGGRVAIHDRGSRSDHTSAGLWAGVQAAFAGVPGASSVTRPGILRELAEAAAPPRATGSQAPFIDERIPAVELENVDPPATTLRAERLTADGQALNDLVGALDSGATAGGAEGSYVRSGDSVVTRWLLALLALGLVAAPALAAVDLVSRAWREHLPVAERALAAATIVVPLTAAGLGIRTVALLGGDAAESWAYPYTRDRWPDRTEVTAAVLGAGLGWLTLRLVRRPRRPPEDGAARATIALAAALGLGTGGATLAILVSPVAGLLLVPALHGWVAIERIRLGGAPARAVLIWFPLLAPAAAVAVGLQLTPGELVRMVADGRIPAAIGVGAMVVVGGAAVLTATFVRRVG